MKILQALKGISGEFEINRVVGAIGGISYIIFANLFEGWEVLIVGKPFDLTAYCLSFPAGLGAVVAAIAGAVAIKDRNVARAIQTRDGTATSAEQQPDSKG